MQTFRATYTFLKTSISFLNVEFLIGFVTIYNDELFCLIILFSHKICDDSTSNMHLPCSEPFINFPETPFNNVNSVKMGKTSR